MAKINKTYQPGDEFTPDSVNEIIAAINSMVDAIYPVGSIYMSINDVNPSTLFGGKWEKIKDKFLLASGDNYQLGETGGEATHKLTIDEIPSHSHDRIVVDGAYPLGWETGDQSGINLVSLGLTNVKPRFSTNNVGGNNAHNIMPPYLAVNIWKRIAWGKLWNVY